MSKVSEKSPWLFYLGRFLFWVSYTFIWRCKVYGAENVPQEGGVIMAPNHLSLADPPLVATGMKRALHFMAKQELFDIPVLGFLIRRTNAFPVKRGTGDIGALRSAKHLLDHGAALLVFPEGTRAKEGKVRPVQSGVGMLACHAQVPVVPVRIINSNRLSSLAQLKLIYGKPIYPPAEYSRDTYKAFSEQVMAEVYKLEA